MTNLLLDKNFYLNKKSVINLINLISSNSINSFIIGGPSGLGKVNFVNTLSKYLLCEFEDDKLICIKTLHSNDYSFDNIKKNKSFYLFNNQSHPDFYYLAKEKNIENKKIPIENIRKLKTFFHKTFSVSKTKIAVINSIEDLSLNALNSLLKTIEELPEKSYIFIISNKPFNIIETIKSRCAFFYINSLRHIDFDNLIHNSFKQITDDEKNFLKNICSGSPGLAQKIVNENIYDIYNELLDNFLDPKSFLLVREVILKIFSPSSKNNELLFSVFQLIINDLIKKSVYFLNENKFLDLTLKKEKNLIQIIINNNNSLKLLNLHSKFDKNIYSADLLNLNKSDILIDIFKDLCGI